MGAIIASQGLAPDPFTPLREWSVRQVWRLSGMACRERWRERTWRAALEGIKPEPEPDWGLDSSGAGDARQDRQAYTAAHEADFAQLKAEVETRPGRCDPEGRKFPGML